MTAKNYPYLVSLYLNKQASQIKQRTGMHIDSAYTLALRNLGLTANPTIEQANKIGKKLGL